MDKSIVLIRPRFEIPVKYSPEETLERVEEALNRAPAHIEGKVVDNHIILDIGGEELHFWSPHLNFRVEEDEDDPTKSMVYGHIGPRPTVWTLFIFFYFSIAVIGFFLTTHGMSKYLLGTYSHYIWSFPIAVIIAFTAFRAGKLGEKLGSDQIEHLKQFLRDSLDL